LLNAFVVLKDDELFYFKGGRLIGAGWSLSFLSYFLSYFDNPFSIADLRLIFIAGFADKWAIALGLPSYYSQIYHLIPLQSAHPILEISLFGAGWSLSFLSYFLSYFDNPFSIADLRLIFIAGFADKWAIALGLPSYYSQIYHLIPLQSAHPILEISLFGAGWSLSFLSYFLSYFDNPFSIADLRLIFIAGFADKWAIALGLPSYYSQIYHLIPLQSAHPILEISLFGAGWSLSFLSYFLSYFDNPFSIADLRLIFIAGFADKWAIALGLPSYYSQIYHLIPLQSAHPILEISLFGAGWSLSFLSYFLSYFDNPFSIADLRLIFIAGFADKWAIALGLPSYYSQIYHLIPLQSAHPILEISLFGAGWSLSFLSYFLSYFDNPFSIADLRLIFIAGFADKWAIALGLPSYYSQIYHLIPLQSAHPILEISLFGAGWSLSFLSYFLSYFDNPFSIADLRLIFIAGFADKWAIALGLPSYYSQIYHLIPLQSAHPILEISLFGAGWSLSFLSYFLSYFDNPFSIADLRLIFIAGFADKWAIALGLPSYYSQIYHLIPLQSAHPILEISLFGAGWSLSFLSYFLSYFDNPFSIADLRLIFIAGFADKWAIALGLPSYYSQIYHLIPLQSAHPILEISLFGAGWSLSFLSYFLSYFDNPFSIADLRLIFIAGFADKWAIALGLPSYYSQIYHLIPLQSAHPILEISLFGAGWSLSFLSYFLSYFDNPFSIADLRLIFIAGFADKWAIALGLPSYYSQIYHLIPLQSAHPILEISLFGAGWSLSFLSYFLSYFDNPFSIADLRLIFIAGFADKWAIALGLPSYYSQIYHLIPLQSAHPILEISLFGAGWSLSFLSYFLSYFDNPFSIADLRLIFIAGFADKWAIALGLPSYYSQIYHLIPLQSAHPILEISLFGAGWSLSFLSYFLSYFDNPFSIADLRLIFIAGFADKWAIALGLPSYYSQIYHLIPLQSAHPILEISLFGAGWSLSFLSYFLSYFDNPFSIADLRLIFIAGFADKWAIALGLPSYYSQIYHLIPLQSAHPILEISLFGAGWSLSFLSYFLSYFDNPFSIADLRLIFIAGFADKWAIALGLPSYYSQIYHLIPLQSAHPILEISLFGAGWSLSFLSYFLSYFDNPFSIADLRLIFIAGFADKWAIALGLPSYYSQIYHLIPLQSAHPILEISLFGAGWSLSFLSYFLSYFDNPFSIADLRLIFIAGFADKWAIALGLPSYYSQIYHLIPLQSAHPILEISLFGAGWSLSFLSYFLSYFDNPFSIADLRLIFIAGFADKWAIALGLPSYYSQIYHLIPLQSAHPILEISLFGAGWSLSFLSYFLSYFDNPFSIADLRLIFIAGFADKWAIALGLPSYYSQIYHLIPLQSAHPILEISLFGAGWSLSFLSYFLSYFDNPFSIADLRLIFIAGFADKWAIALGLPSYYSQIYHLIPLQSAHPILEISLFGAGWSLSFLSYFLSYFDNPFSIADLRLIFIAGFADKWAIALGLPSYYSQIYHLIPLQSAHPILEISLFGAGWSLSFLSYFLSYFDNPFSIADLRLIFIAGFADKWAIALGLPSYYSQIYHLIPLQSAHPILEISLFGAGWSLSFLSYFLSYFDNPFSIADLRLIFIAGFADKWAIALGLPSYYSQIYHLIPLQSAHPILEISLFGAGWSLSFLSYFLSYFDNPFSIADLRLIFIAGFADKWVRFAFLL
jgi:hypothetical protein